MSAQIINFGSLNLDTVLSVPHIARPGETISAQKVESFCGGKGFNQTIALIRAGCQVYHAGKLGTGGEPLRAALEENGADCRYLLSSLGRTGSAVIQRADSGENCIVLDGGSNQEITQEEIDAVLEHFFPEDVLVCQNEISHLPYLLKAASRRGMRVALNPSPIDPELLACDLSGVTWLILNEIEGEGFTGKTDPQEVASALLARYPHMKVVLTLGGEGSVYADKEQCCRCIAVPISVVDTTAAGDTFLGYFLAAVLAGEQPEAALKRASHASSLAISVPGALPSIPTAQAVEAFLEERDS